MRLQNIILPIVALLLSSVAVAQQMDLSNTSVEKVDDNVVISFKAKTDKVPTNNMLTITPVLWNEVEKVTLPQIIVMGRNKAISQTRIAEYPKDTSLTILDKATLKTDYHTTIPFEKTMERSSLSLYFELEKYDGPQSLSPRVLLSDQMVPVLPPISISEIFFESDVKEVFATEAQKEFKEYPFVYHVGDIDDENKGNVIVYFKQGRTDIDREFMGNDQTLLQIAAALELVKSNPKLSLAKVNVEGGSSPEGSAQYNEKIALKRAESLTAIFNIGYSHLFEVDNIGENWKVLYSMVENSDMEHKDTVLSIIDNNPDYDDREKILKKLAKGEPYKYMLKEFFPVLRKASYVQVFYNIVPDSDFDMIDQASKLIAADNYKKALDILLEVKPTPYTDNLIGVCLTMKADSENARLYFQRAIEAGNTDATKNLEKLDEQQSNVQYN